MSSDNQNEIQDLSSLHHYRTEIPNILFDMNLDPHKFYVLINHFYHNQEISLKDWKYFESKGMAERISLSNEEILFIIQSKKPQFLEKATKICDWCCGTSFVLHSHHYPKKKSCGGETTVNICPNCHYEYHYLSDITYRIKKEFVVEAYQ